MTEISVATDTGGALTFDPGEITVPAGATVRLTFTNKATVPHNLTFEDPIGAATDTVIDPGDSQTIEFTAPTHRWTPVREPGQVPTLMSDLARRARSSVDRAADFGSAGRGFESLRARQLPTTKRCGRPPPRSGWTRPPWSRDDFFAMTA